MRHKFWFLVGRGKKLGEKSWKQMPLSHGGLGVSGRVDAVGRFFTFFPGLLTVLSAPRILPLWFGLEWRSGYRNLAAMEEKSFHV